MNKTHNEIIQQKDIYWMDIDKELFEAYKNNTITQIITLEEISNMRDSHLKDKAVNYINRKDYLIGRMIQDGDFRIFDELLDIERKLVEIKHKYIFEYGDFDKFVPIVKIPKYKDYLDIMLNFIHLDNPRMTEDNAKYLLDLEHLEEYKNAYKCNKEGKIGTKENLKEYKLLIDGLEKIKASGSYSVWQWMEDQTK